MSIDAPPDTHVYSAFAWAYRYNALMMTAQLERLSPPVLLEVVEACDLLKATAKHLLDKRST